MTTMTEVARHANVSLATVSLVLNQRDEAGRISETTKQRVLEAAGDLGYRRNALLDAVRAKHNKMLGFLVHRPENEAVARMLAGALDEAEERDYTIKVLRLRDREINDYVIEKCLELRLTGVMALYLEAGSLKKLRTEMERFQVPLAVLDSSRGTGRGELRIASDDAQGMNLGVEYLKNLGHRRIAFYAPSQIVVTSKRFIARFTERQKAFCSAMSAAELPVQDEWIITDQVPARAESLLSTLLARKAGNPTAFIGATDGLSLKIGTTALKMGVSVPDEVSVLSYGDLSLAMWGDPPLTCVAQPFNEIGRVAVRRLLESGTEEGLVPTVDALPSQIVERDSCAPCRDLI